MPVPSERLAGWLSLKWLVAGVAIAADGLLLSYDLRLGLAAGSLLAAVTVIWLYIALRYGSLSSTPSVRMVPVERAREQENLRRLAAQRKLARSDTRPGAGPDEVN